MAKEVLVPDVGEAKDVEVIEILVSVGDTVKVDDSLVVLESDKASMEIPSPYAGKVVSIAVKVGDTVDEGAVILAIEAETDNAAKSPAPEPEEPELSEEPEAKEPESPSSSEPGQPAPQETTTESEITVVVPEVGDAKDIVVTELLVKPGDTVSADQSLVVLESDKASMEIPSPQAGTVTGILVKEGDEVTEGDALLTLKTSGTLATPVSAAEDVEQEPAAEATSEVRKPAPAPSDSTGPSEKVHAGPAVRKQAREYGVDLAAVKGSGPNGRILKEDVQEFVKARLKGGGEQGSGIPAMPDVDFSRFGPIEMKPLSRIRRASARNLHRAWLNVPHVTQFDEADITELEAFRKSQNAELSGSGSKLTPLAFLVKACVNALMKYPQFNSSIDAGYEHLVIKQYYNIGIAVETDDGLMVPVVKEADKKGIVELAQSCAELARQAREKKLPLDAMQGATFSISSLGGIGGTAFTPIVNAPEVAILGVSRSKVVPVWNGSEFTPRTILPLSLSYDHRAIDGAEAARFTDYLAKVLSDLRRMLL